MTQLQTKSAYAAIFSDEYFFCEEKIFAAAAAYYGRDSELMFGGALNFSYNKGLGGDCIGRRLCVHYPDMGRLMEKYHGITAQKLERDDKSCDLLSFCRGSGGEYHPAAIGLDNRCSLWPRAKGNHQIALLPFFIDQIEGDENFHLIDPHQNGLLKIVPRETIEKSWKWCTRFDVLPIQKEPDLRELIAYILESQEWACTQPAGADDILCTFPNLRKSPRFFRRSGMRKYEAMLDLSRDMLTATKEAEAYGFNEMLFVPLYFDFMALYRLRMCFSKLLLYIGAKTGITLTETMIKAQVCSAKWLMLKMLLKDAFTRGADWDFCKRKISEEIKCIARYENEINEELTAVCLSRSPVSVPDAKDTGEKAVRPQDPRHIDLQTYYNHFLFNRYQKVSPYGERFHNRYTYQCELPFGGIREAGGVSFQLPFQTPAGDSVVCAGQSIPVRGAAEKLAVLGTALYDKPVCDYFFVRYADGTAERLAVGFDGWTPEESARQGGSAVFSAKVQKRMEERSTAFERQAFLYLRQYPLQGKTVSEMILPYNPFLCVCAITLLK